MGFLLRSVFWLSLAFVLVAPRQGAGGHEDGPGLLAQIIHTMTAECDASLPCQGGRALASMSLNSNPSTGAPMQDLPANSPVPFPRPRPDWTG